MGVSLGAPGRAKSDVRLGFVSSAAISALPPVVRELLSQWPGIDLELREETTDAQIQLIAAGALDAGIAREVRNVAGLSSTLLQNERLVVAVPTDHPWPTGPQSGSPN
ncbi:DNA-binding transcriptional LysR family regulator [Pseudarthrobacter defluvii]|nr:LysR family substrate-binding domain-containing protein [Pseudarthrobacter defluvii]MDQ0769408.1 DNA-binding transcriptional LysR family regulator [Pseudarthrobacter defluvii]